jgi:hypothetical protein
MSGRSRKQRSSTLALTPEMVADESRLMGVLDELLTTDDDYKKLTKRILRAQRQLRKTSTEEAFQLYLDIEAITNARVNFMLGAVAKFCFNAGRRRHQRQLKTKRR